MALPETSNPQDGISPDAKPAPETAPPRSGTTESTTNSAEQPTATTTTTQPSASASAPVSVTDGSTIQPDDEDFNPVDFDGSVDSNHELPTPETLRRIDKYLVLDRHGKSHTFRSLYTGRHVARRVLIIFVRHFYCGNCQEYLRALSSSSITPSSLLALPNPTFIAVVGCGDPALIDMYAAATGCPFPIYADPTRRLYDELGMVRTLALGSRPAYTKQHLLVSSLHSVVQVLKQTPRGLALKGGDQRQIGGEFLFEPPPKLGAAARRKGNGNEREGDGDGDGGAISPTAVESMRKQVVSMTLMGKGEEDRQRGSQSSLDGKFEDDEGEDKIVTWCHRMKNTRDHAEIPEIMEVLGLDGHGLPVGDKERWEKALKERKGTGLSLPGKQKADATATTTA